MSQKSLYAPNKAFFCRINRFYDIFYNHAKANCSGRIRGHCLGGSAISGGVGAPEIREKLAFPIETRTLQRRLELLEEKGRIRITGQKKGTRYFPVEQLSVDNRKPDSGGTSGKSR